MEEDRVLGKRTWDDAYDTLKQIMESVLGELLYVGIKRVDLSNPLITKLGVIDKSKPLLDIADTRLLKDKLRFLRALEIQNRIPIIRHELPLLITYLIGAYTNVMKKDNDTVLVDGVKSGIEFLLWWFRQKNTSTEIIDQAFQMINDTVEIFESFQESNNYAGFNNSISLLLYKEYTEDILYTLNKASFTGMAVRFNPIAIENTRKTMRAYAAAILCLDAAIPTLFEIFGKAKRFSTRYRMFAYLDLLIASAVLAVTIPDGDFRIEDVAINVILLFPVMLKAEFAYMLLEGRGFPAITDFTPRTSYTVVETLQMGAMSMDPFYIWFQGFLGRRFEQAAVTVLSSAGVAVIGSVLGVVGLVFRDARKFRTTALLLLSTAAATAIGYEAFNKAALNSMIYSFDYDVTNLTPDAISFTYVIGNITSSLPLTLGAFVAQHGTMSMQFDHSGMLSNGFISFVNARDETVGGITDKSVHQDAWKVPISAKVTGAVKIMLLGMTMFGKSAVLNAMLPDTELQIVKVEPVNLVQQLFDELGYSTLNKTHYTYEIAGFNVSIGVDAFKGLYDATELKDHKNALDFITTVWKSKKGTKADAKLADVTWENNRKALNLLKDAPLVSRIVPRFIEMLDKPAASEVMSQADLESARAEINSNLLLLYKKFGLLNDRRFPPVFNQEYNPVQLQCLNEQVRYYRDVIILKLVEMYELLVYGLYQKEVVDLYTLVFLRGTVALLSTGLVALGIHKVISKAIENALKPSKERAMISNGDMATSYFFNWGPLLVPVMLSFNITLEMIDLWRGHENPVRLEFWKGFWGIPGGMQKTAAYNNGVFYGTNPMMFIPHAFVNVNYFLPRPDAAQMIIDGAYIQRPRPILKPGRRHL